MTSASQENVLHVKACSRCPAPRDTSGRYCRTCRASYMRDRRRRQRRRVDALLDAAAGLCRSNTRRARRVALAVELVTLAMASEASA